MADDSDWVGAYEQQQREAEELASKVYYMKLICSYSKEFVIKYFMSKDSTMRDNRCLVSSISTFAEVRIKTLTIIYS